MANRTKMGIPVSFPKAFPGSSSCPACCVPKSATYMEVRKYKLLPLPVLGAQTFGAYSPLSPLAWNKPHSCWKSLRAAWFLCQAVQLSFQQHKKSRDHKSSRNYTRKKDRYFVELLKVLQKTVCASFTLYISAPNKSKARLFIHSLIPMNKQIIIEYLLQKCFLRIVTKLKIHIYITTSVKESIESAKYIQIRWLGNIETLKKKSEGFG